MNLFSQLLLMITIVAQSTQLFAIKTHSLVDRKECLNQYRQNVIPLRKLYQTIPISARLQPISESPRSKLARMRDDACEIDPDRSLKLIQRLATPSKLKKIGILFPLTGPRSTEAHALMQGMMLSFKDAKTSSGTLFANNILVRDHGDSTLRARQLLVDLIFKEDIQTLILFGNKSVQSEVSALVASLSVALIQLGNVPKNKTSDHPAKFRQFFPSSTDLAKGVVFACQKKGIHRLAILAPYENTSAKLIEDLRRQEITSPEKRHDLMLLPTFHYRPNDHASMEAAVSKLVNNSARYDAIYIPDHFRNVRHLAALFRFFGVHHVQLIGDHRWRADGLLEPYDRLLDGAIFVDFIGDYSTLPSEIQPLNKVGQNLAPASATEGLDFRYIGWRLGQQLKGNQDFDQISWPTTTFEIFGRTVQAIGKDGS